MSFLNFIRDSFDRVLAVDSEFCFADHTKTIQNRVVCFVYKDIFTNDVFKYWTHDKRFNEPPFDWNRVLLVPFNAVAEGHSWLHLLQGMPRNIYDTYVENARLYKTFRSGKGALDLRTTAQHYGIPEVMTKEHKDEMRDMVIENASYTAEQREKILDYCLEDVELTQKIFIKQVEDIEKKNNLKTIEDYKTEISQIMFRGASQLHVAKIERAGININYSKVLDFKKYWPEVEDTIIKRLDKDIRVHDEDGTERYDYFVELVKRIKLFGKWERTFKTNKLRTDKKYIDKMIKKFPEILDLQIYKQIKSLKAYTKLTVFNPCADGKLRCSWNMFGTETGRCTPSTNANIFGGAKWQRSLIRPGLGYVMYYLDYEQQELAIQGYLSGDKKLIEAYNSGDGYLQSAKWLNLVPEYATKKTHPEEREIVKVLFLAQGYGAGPGYVSGQVRCSILYAQHLLRMFRRLFSTYNDWIKKVLKKVAITGKITTNLGWQRYSNGTFKINKDGQLKSIRNTLLNFPAQGNGSDILRQAIIKLHEAGFIVNAPVHDALLISVPRGNHKKEVKLAQSIMEQSAEFVIGSKIRVGIEEVDPDFNVSEKDKKIFNLIFDEINKFKYLAQSRQQPTPML
jgi:DNA polymerase I-like protein with 3'-5' exonuclease and polymerase domains|tara:strand:- start:1418 stop:3286 length:1869 start_codon:yes stop_codon:yes gene_type:complete